MGSKNLKSFIGWIGVISALVLGATNEANASTPKKLTVQGVIRRQGATGASALVTYTPSSPNVTVTLRCEGTCNGASPVTYSVAGGGLLANGSPDSLDDVVVNVNNGAFSASVIPSAATAQDMATYSGGSWSIVINGTLDPLSPSTTFPIYLEGVPFAKVADFATSASMIQGVTVNLAANSNGNVLTWNNGALTLQSVTGGGGGGGGTTYTAGTGITITGASNTVLNVDTTAIAPLTSGKVANTLLNMGAANGVPMLDGTTHLVHAELPTLLASDIPMLNATSIPNLNASTLYGSLTGVTQIQDSALTDNAIVLTDGSDNLISSTSGVTDTQLGYLNSLTANVQTQINSAVAGGGAGKVAKAGDTMSGALNVGAGVNANSFSIFNQSAGPGVFTLGDTGTHNIGLRAPSSLLSNQTLTLPATLAAGGFLQTDASGNLSWVTIGGGNVGGPGSSTNTALARWNGVGGTAIMDSTVLLDGAGNLSGVSNLTSTGLITTANIKDNGLTASQIILTDGSKNLISSASNTTDTELGYVHGVTASIQTQLNAKQGTVTQGTLMGAGAITVGNGTNSVIGTGVTLSIATATTSTNGILTSTDWNTFNSGANAAANKVAKAGDTMSGGLQTPTLTNLGLLTSATVNVTGLSPSQIILTDGSNNLISSTSGVTDTQLGYLNSLTANVQTQINSAVAGGGAGKVAKAGDTMSGALNVGAGVNANSFSIFNQSGGVGSISLGDTGTHNFSLRAPSSLTANETWTLPLTASTGGQFLQSDASGNLSWVSVGGGNVGGPGSSTNFAIAKFNGTGGSTIMNSGITIDASNNMSGAANIGANGLNSVSANVSSLTASQLVSTDASKNLVSTALGSLGSTGAVSVTGTGSVVGSGLTVSIATATTSTNGILTSTDWNTFNNVAAGGSAAGKVAKAGDTMSGSLNIGAGLNAVSANVASLSASQIILTDASKNLISSTSGTTDTQLGYLNSLTANVQTQINAAVAGGGAGKVAKTGDTMSGGLNVQSTILATGAVTGASYTATADGAVQFNNTANTFSVQMTAPSALGVNLNLVLPSTAGTANYMLVTDGAGNLSWLNPTASVLTGFATTSGTVAATDSILVGLEKLQYQISNYSVGAGTITFPSLDVGSSESDTNRVVRARLYGNQDTDGGTPTWTNGTPAAASAGINVITRVPLSMANTDCGVADVAGATGSVVCAGF